MRTFLQRHFDGPGGTRELMVLAVPMIVSQAAETVMLFFDRLFLSVLGKEHLAACMGGGLTSFMMLTFFLGLINYVNPLAAQYLGSGQKSRCSTAGAQGVLVALLSTPFVLALIPVGRWMLQSSGHGELQTQLEVEYFTILAFGCVLPLMRTALSSFFAGIGRTRVVMVANLIAMVVNVAGNYVLIFGHWGFPALGIRGAAFGTLLGSAVGTLILVTIYFSGPMHAEYDTRKNLGVSLDVLRRLFRFGMPGGIEFFMNLTAFNLFVLMFHSYGPDAAAAITIAFNWDLVAFLPLIGVNIAVTSLVGRYMGAGEPDIASRTTHSGVKLTFGYGLLMTYLFLFHTRALIAPFTTGGAPGEFDQVIPLAITTLRIAALYVIGDGLIMVFDGVLRGAGDTQWTMRVSVCLHWIMTGICYVLIKHTDVSPITSWAVFILLIYAIGIALILRYRHGYWRSIRVVELEHTPLVVTPDNPAPPDVR